MTSIRSITLQTPDPSTAEAFCADAFGLGHRVRAEGCSASDDGFRGFAMSLVVSGPATVDAFVDAALRAGAAPCKPAGRSLWGYGGVVRGPDGTIWKIATSSKRSADPATRTIDELVLLLGVQDVVASKRFYADHGFEVTRSFGRRYAQFSTAEITLALYGHRALAKDLGVAPGGVGARRIVIDGDAGAFTDPDGFEWETAGRAQRREPATARPSGR